MQKTERIFTMQINNNVQSPNFGMAMKIKCSPKDLEAAGLQVLENLAKAGEELANTKYWDLEVLAGQRAGQLRYRVNGNHCANAYIGRIRGKEVPHNEFLTIKSTWDGTDGVGGKKKGEACETVMRLANKEAALKAYDALDTAYELDNAVAATKVLDEWTTFQRAQRAAEDVVSEQTQQAAADLFKKFGSVEI